jgi:hypothetical protein
MKKSPITIIDDKNLRGVLAPAETLSKEMLEDIVDFIELSTSESIKEDEARMKEADKSKSWIPLEEVENRLKSRLKCPR